MLAKGAARSRTTKKGAKKPRHGCSALRAFTMVKQGKTSSSSPVVISVALALVLLAGALVLSQQHKTGDEDCAADSSTASEEAKRNWRERIGKSQKKYQARTVEVCVSDVESAKAAVAGGATSLELCSNRPEGGVTPSVGFIQAVVGLCKSTHVTVNVLIRPRPGGFVYSSSEFDVMIRDIVTSKSYGVDGIVTGVLDSSGRIDVTRMKIIRSVCGDLCLTFHRAFDVVEFGRDAEEDGLQAAVETVFLPELCGCDRLLTSGRSSSAATTEGMHTLSKISALAAALPISSSSSSPGKSKSKTVVAAAGISLASMAEIIAVSGVQGVHLGSAACRDPPLPEPEEIGEGMERGGGQVHMGRDADVWLGADVAKVEAVVLAAEAAWNVCPPTPSPPVSPLSPFSPFYPASLAASTDLLSPSSPGSSVGGFEHSSSQVSSASLSGSPPSLPSPSPTSPSSNRSSGSYVMVCNA